VEEHERPEAEPQNEETGIGAGWETGGRHEFESRLGRWSNMA
jgi:hypothetical protein